MSTAPSMHDYILRQPEILSSVYDRKESWLTRPSYVHSTIHA